jgi:hypothetical protein
MPTPEQERPLSAEQVRKPSFEERLRGLIEPKVDEEGKVLQEAAIRNEKLQRLGRLALESRNQTPEGLGKLLGKGDDWCLDEQVPEDEWSVLAGVLVERQELLTKEQKKSLQERVPEGRIMVPARLVPPHMWALFETGTYAADIESGFISKESHPVLDVRKKRDRGKWLFENFCFTMNGAVSDPAEKWKMIVDSWINEFETAAEFSRLSLEEIKGFEKDIKEVMAIGAAARAMDASNGSAAKYVGFITQSDPEYPNLNRQEDWSEYILQGDPDKISSVLENNNLVRFYYEQLLKDAKVTKEWDLKEEEREREEEKEELTRDNVLLSFLEDSGRKGGFRGYIDEVLLRTEIGDLEKEGFSREEKWAAARLACDIFLVDKYTKWEYTLDKAGDKELKPSPTWGSEGADPFRSLLEPSFLPRRITRVYQDGVVLDLVDEAFRPIENFKNIGQQPLEARVAGVGLKDYAQWNEALRIFLGSPRAEKVPDLTNETIEEDLLKVAKLLDNVYGKLDKPEEKIGKRIVGTMMAKIILAKASAAVTEVNPEPNSMRILFGHESVSKGLFSEAEEAIWGPGGDARGGVLVELAWGETRLIFDDEAKNDLNKAAEILFYCGQTPRQRRKAKFWNGVGFVLDAIRVVNDVNEESRYRKWKRENR